MRLMSRFCRQQQVDGYVRWCSISVNAVTPSCTQPLLEQSERCPCDDEACHEPCQLAQRWEARGEPHQPAKHCGRTTPYRRQIYSIAFTPVRTVAFTVIATRAAQPLLYWRERAAVHGEEHCVRGSGMGRFEVLPTRHTLILQQMARRGCDRKRPCTFLCFILDITGSFHTSCWDTEG
jgi:hypothetical protein